MMKEKEKPNHIQLAFIPLIITYWVIVFSNRDKQLGGSLLSN